MARISRAAMLGTPAAAAAISRSSAPAQAFAGSAEGGHGLTPQAALAALETGNARYARDAALYCNRNYDRRAEVYAAQAPFAIVLGCSDSRVPPEVVFD